MTLGELTADRPVNRTGNAGQPPAEGLARQSLFHPVVDFLCLGGGSIIVFAALAFWLSPKTDLALVGAWAALIAHGINNPHFAYSYQIFYRGFARKAFGRELPAGLRRRYQVAGILVPIALVAFFAVGIFFQLPKTVAFGINIMGFLVGWHYVKQGYGMLMVDAVLQRRFFTEAEKRLLVINAYACWALSWLLINLLVAERIVQGISSALLKPPMAVVYAGIVAAAVSTGLTAYMLVRKLFTGGRLPINGTVAYFVTLYVWISPLVNPLFLIVIPALHSLQYLTVVGRYQWNATQDRTASQIEAGGTSIGRPALPFAGFAAAGIVLGYIGFWGLPQLLDQVMPYDHRVFSGTLFIFMFWIFINVHHYFLDNVMWRRENPETGKYLFGRR